MSDARTLPLPDSTDVVTESDEENNWGQLITLEVAAAPGEA